MLDDSDDACEDGGYPTGASSSLIGWLADLRHG
jgi:hypothetical protein